LAVKFAWSQDELKALYEEATGKIASDGLTGFHSQGTIYLMQNEKAFSTAVHEAWHYSEWLEGTPVTFWSEVNAFKAEANFVEAIGGNVSESWATTRAIERYVVNQYPHLVAKLSPGDLQYLRLRGALR
jgi:hypothetical protein